MRTACGQCEESGFADRSLTEAVERASRLAVNSSDIASVLVVPGRRPTYEELSLIRESVALLDVDLTVRGDGSIAVRKQQGLEQVQAESERTTPIRLIVATERRAIATIERMCSELVNWDAGFNGLAEGIR